MKLQVYQNMIEDLANIGVHLIFCKVQFIELGYLPKEGIIGRMRKSREKTLKSRVMKMVVVSSPTGKAFSTVISKKIGTVELTKSPNMMTAAYNEPVRKKPIN